MNIQELQSKTVDWLRFPLIVGVVFIHTKYFAPEAVPLADINYANLSTEDIGVIISSIFSIFIPCVAVPLFFMISGYFFFYKLNMWNKSVYLDKIKSRIKTLVIPYLLWNTIALAGIIYLNYNIPNETIIEKNNSLFFYIRGYIIHTGFTPYLQPMWFIRDLIILSIGSPILYFLIKKMNYYIIFVFLLIYILFYILSINPIFMIFGPSLFYFSLGAFLSINNLNMIEEARKIKSICEMICVISLFLFLYLKGNGYWKYITPFYIISGIIVTLKIVSYLYENQKIRLNPFLSKASFFVFAVHELFLLNSWKTIFIKLNEPLTALSGITGYFVVPILTIFSALIIFYLLQRYFPKITSILTGSRS
ncbi:acyltransferase [Flavobacterium sp.]|uniref:acyltransferase n=1 Tax=Flavobacterium sp. TaxID=239 RepID=UPI0031D74BC1